MVGEAQNSTQIFSCQQILHQLPEGGLALTPHDVVDEFAVLALADLLCCQGRMIATKNRLSARLFGDPGQG